ncbi:CDP-glycerol glycerophosphotransferase family protein [Treponema zioleckii]|uniref:CDP-glycerol glycerophosphotransferase family protein n=1 Tax=Treponema zioleckii TaxID=331680 RepID=UPI00168BD41C|nr:CDP-glycerol glycerophosphotransferase family protein [Treponema zioleckii]
MMLLYIDPGTGSMLFSVFIGVLSTFVFLGRKLYMKLKFVIAGGKTDKIDSAKIPYVIFTDHKRYWNIFKPICDEFEARGVPLVYWTASPDDPALSADYKHVKAEFIGEGNKAFARLNMMNAGIVLSTTPGLDVYQWKRSKTVDYYVHIRHDVEDPVGYRMFGCDFYDAILLSGAYQEYYIRLLEKKRDETPKETAVVGCPYMDVMKERLSKLPFVKNEKPVILLAPSWGASAILKKYGSEILDSLISTGYKIIVRPHPQSYTSEKDMIEPLIAKYTENENFIWNRDNDNFEVLHEADVLITDFSGIIFDYSLIFDKPIIYADTSYDNSPYDSAWLDEELWRFKVLPDLGVKLEQKDFGNLKAIIDNLMQNESFQKGREKIRNEAWEYQGEGAKRTVDYLIAKHEELKEK